MPFPVERFEGHAFEGHAFEGHANDAAVAALSFHQQGFNVLPCYPRDKRTKVRWKRWQVERQRRTDVNALFDGHEGNIGIICGQGSGNLCAIDIEDKSLFEEFAIEFERVCGLTWMVITARGGHIYCLTDAPVKPQKGHLFEIRGQGQYILGPGSIHWSGVLYEYRSKPERIARVTSLPFCELQYIEPQTLTAARRSSAWDILNRYQGRVGSYSSRSEFDQAIIQACVNAGEDLNQIRMVLRSAQCRTHYQRVSTERGPEAAEDFLDISYRTATRLPDSAAAENALAIAADVRTWAISTSWPGRTGLSDKAVLMAHITRCEQAKRREYHLSCRDGAEIARVGHTTFTQATRRLIQSNVLQRVEHARLKDAASYRIVPLADTVALPTGAVRYADTSSRSGVDEEVSVQRTDAMSRPQSDCKRARRESELCLGQTPTGGIFERAILGKAAEDVWLALGVSGLAQGAIASQTGRAKSTVSTALRKLVEHELARQLGNQYIQANPNFENLAANLDSSHIAAQRRERHSQQRREYHKTLESQRPSEQP